MTVYETIPQEQIELRLVQAEQTRDAAQREASKQTMLKRDAIGLLKDLVRAMNGPDSHEIELDAAMAFLRNQK